MTGLDERNEELFFELDCEAQEPVYHPLRRIRAIVDEALDGLSSDTDGPYSRLTQLCAKER